MKKMIIIHFYCCVTQRTFFWEIDGQRNYHKVQTVFFYVRYQPVVNVTIWSCIELVFRLQLGLLELEFELLGLCAGYG